MPKKITTDFVGIIGENSKNCEKYFSQDLRNINILSVTNF